MKPINKNAVASQRAMKTKRNVTPLCAAIALTLFGGTAIQAQTTYTWIQTAGGAQSWSTAANWNTDPLVPSPVSGDTVDFSTVNIAANTTLTLGADRTAEIWKFGDTSGAQTWTVNAGNQMILAGTTPTIQTQVDVTLSNVLAGGAGWNKTGAGRLYLLNANIYTGGTSISAGQVAVGNTGSFSSGTVTFAGDSGILGNYGAFPVIANSIAVNPGVTASFFNYNQYYGFATTGALTGDTTATVAMSGSSNGSKANGFADYSVGFLSDANTFTGTIRIDSGGGQLKVNSLADSANPIKIAKGSFMLGQGAATPLVFNSRQIELTGTTVGATLENTNATASNTITINTGLLVSGVGNKTLTLQGSNTGANTFGGQINDATGSVISLTKAGGGTWVLSGTNDYSGATALTAGKLVEVVGGSSANSDVTVSGGTLGVSITDNTKQWTCKSLSHTGSSTLEFDFGANPPSTTVAPLKVGGNVAFFPAPTVNGTGAGLTGLAPGLYPLLTWTGALSGTPPTSVTLSSGSGNLIVDTANKTLLLNVQGTRGTLTWQGPDGAEWKANDSSLLYWQDATLATTYYQEATVGGNVVGDSVVFSDIPGGTVTLNTSVSPSGVSVGGAVDYVISGTGGIAGGGSLTKTGASTLTLATANTFVGTTTVGGGTLQLANANAIGSSSGLLVTGGNVVIDPAVTANVKSLRFETGNNARTVSGGTLAFAPGGSISTNNNQTDQTITSAITGSPTVNIKDLGASNTYKGIKFAPDSGTVTLGAVLNPDNTGTTDKAGITMAGSTSGNSVASINYAGGDQYADTNVQSGEWTVGGIRTGTVRISGGTLILNGTATAMYNGFFYTGGTLTGNASLQRNDRRGNHDFLSGFTVAPGNGVGTITVLDGTAQTVSAVQQFTIFRAGSIYDWQVGAANTTDTVHIAKGKLQLDGFTLKIRDAGGSPVATDHLPVFTYDASVTTRTLALGSVVFDTSALGAGWNVGTLALTDDGAGTIYLTGLSKSGGASPYDTWKAQITNGLNLRTDDADGDGFTNLQEFLFGASPIAGNGSLVTTTTNGGNIVLRWLQRETGSTYTLKQSATLASGSWAPAAQSPALDAVQTGAPTDYDYYTVTIPTSGGKLFFRIEGVEN